MEEGISFSKQDIDLDPSWHLSYTYILSLGLQRTSLNHKATRESPKERREEEKLLHELENS